MDLNARNIMRHPVICAREEMTVREVLGLLREKRVSGVPVVDAQERMVGVVSVTDLIAVGPGDSDRSVLGESDFHTSPAMDNLAAAEGLIEPEPEVLDLPISALMSRRVITVSEDAPLGELAELMVYHRIHRLVVARADRIVGIVSVLDILQALRDQHLAGAA